MVSFKENISKYEENNHRQAIIQYTHKHTPLVHCAGRLGCVWVRVFWVGWVGVKGFEGRVSGCVAWGVGRTDVFVPSPASAAPGSAAGTESSPGGSSAGPGEEEEGQRGGS